MGFTHVEFLPVMEHPFYGSWGYQTTGYFAPTSRYGTPQDFMYLIDYLHQHGIGVILDWVPAHFPRDEHGLGYFDGTHLYEHADPRQGFHPDWGTLHLQLRPQRGRNFLISNALFWLDKYHIDGLRVDAVASMLYLDYSRKDGRVDPQPVRRPREPGGHRLPAPAQRDGLRASIPDVQTIAEESTAWPMVSRPTYLGGLGFGLKWDMGWMHDTLDYFAQDPVHRKYHHNQLTFRMLYAFTENFVLPLSHDEVVHGKGSLLGKMPGDDWQKFANLRLLFGYMYAQPGKKLLFMGGEFGQWNEWNHDSSLDWHLLDYPPHARPAALGARPEPLLPRRAGPARARLRPGRVRVDRLPTTPSNSVAQPPAQGPRRRSDCAAGRVQLHAGAAAQLPGRRAARRALGRVLNSDAPLYGGSGQGNFGGVTAAPVGLARPRPTC